MTSGAPIKDTAAMIAGMAPMRDPETWFFCTTNDKVLAAKAVPHALTVFAEEEGQSLILPEVAARDLGFELEMPMTRITLSVHSALDGVGLTAAVATALAGAHIPCNMVAAYHHDHAFVPSELADQAMDVLLELAQAGAS
ncbi:ACT domain-containing protein [Roseovarius rhodophyticola]|uniref:ACT domain-containing protein n=1 Tax=Roseovarius rhodophyticola TaxID=3080827 RepID=A0ABZ2TD98_9RHOB|nr:ACT domain-containing protein [Roseovarius sp. W115]MDV2931384.1 ACT domain-containing protein [Roseovarius sp. W115]